MQFINRNSFILVASAIILGLAFVLLRDGVRATDLLALASLMAAFAAAFWLLRPGRSAEGKAEEILARIGAGKAVLVEFQSNF